jgi:integrase
MGFVKAKLGPFSQLYKEIATISPMKARKLRKNNPQTVDQIEKLTAQLPEGPAAMVWDMVTTGMGWTEYAGAWEEKGDRVLIHGNKTDNRDRQVPKVYPLNRRVLQYKRFRERVRDVSGKKVAIYDFRRTYATWMESAGIPRTRRKLYLGHTAQDITDLYESVQVDDFLKADGDTLRSWIQRQRHYPATIVPQSTKVFQWETAKKRQSQRLPVDVPKDLAVQLA